MHLSMKSIDKTTRRKKSLLYTGVIITSVGLTFMIIGTHMLLNPELTMGCNGVVTNSVSCKLKFTLLSGIPVLLGIGLLFYRKRL